MKSVNSALKKDMKNDNIRLTYNARTEKVTVHVKNGYQLVIRGRMSVILGFGREEIKTTKGLYIVDLRTIMTLFCVV